VTYDYKNQEEWKEESSRTFLKLRSPKSALALLPFI